MNENDLTMISECIISILNPIYKLQAAELPSKIFMLEANTPKMTDPWDQGGQSLPSHGSHEQQGIQESQESMARTGPPNLDNWWKRGPFCLLHNWVCQFTMSFSIQKG